MKPICKICSPFVAGLTSPIRTASDQVATRERVDNIRVMPISGFGRPRAAVEKMKLWENGRTLRVRFLDGQPEVQAKVQSIAREWEALANLRLQFVGSGTAQIRVSFADQGFSWSTVGTDALGVATGDATMNYGWLEVNTPLREYQRVVRHEFGHALGMIHEHQNPAAQGQIPWDRPKVYAHYAEQGWSQEDVDHNIFEVYAEDTTNHSAFDPASIMQYAIPDALTVGSYAIGWNSDFSPTDIAFMRRQYPKDVPAMTELTIGGPRHHADLATAGEVDSYHFTARAATTSIIDTDGPTDTVLTLHGPNDQGAVLTWNDDSGRGGNARIVRKLQPGEYWVTVRHKKPTATGQYSIGISKRRN
ncbi:MAG: M12 family metallopeptidase [Burkholderiaceae bacterium]